MCERAVKSHAPLNVIWPGAADRPDIVRGIILEKCHETGDTSLSDCFKDDPCLVKTALRASVAAVFDHYPRDRALVDSCVGWQTREIAHDGDDFRGMNRVFSGFRSALAFGRL